MRKAVGTVVLLVTASLFFMFAANAYAFNTTTTRCSSCHSGSGVAVAASLVSTTTTTASYSVLVTGGTAWAVFDGATRVNGALGTAGNFTVAPGKTYDVFGTASTRTGGIGVVSVSPVAPPVVPPTTNDTTTPTTTSDAKASYRGAAIVRLTATDNVGGWGVAYIYYSIDGGRVHLMMLPVLDTSFAIAAPPSGSVVRTISFWSQDGKGNVEPAKTASFTQSARTRMSMPIAVNHTSVYRNRSVRISGTVAKAGIKVVLYVKKPGATSYRTLKTLTVSGAKKWSYTTTPGRHGSYYFKVKFAGDSEWLASGSSHKRVYVR